jgi:DNA polymerase-3 subunit beta
MKITCERGYLAQALGVASRAVSSRNTLPILSNVLLEANSDRVLLTATDLDTSIRAALPAFVERDGEVSVPASLLSDVVSRLPDAPVTLELGDGKVSVRSGKSEYTIVSLPAEDFPVVPQVKDGALITLPQGTLKEMLRLTTFAAAKEENRSILMGVLFEARGSTLTLVATDTHRLSWKQTPISDALESPVSAIVPAKPLSELERVLRDTLEDTVSIRFSGSQVQFETGSVTLVSRVLDGAFPPYERLIPKNCERKLTFDRAALLDAMRRVQIVAKNSSQRSVWRTKGDALEVTAESQDVGKAFEEVPISMEGGDITIAFNALYLNEVLGIVAAEKMTLEMQGPLQPSVMRADNKPDFLYIVMPMNV